MAEEKLIIKVQLDDNNVSQKLRYIKDDVDALNRATRGDGIAQLKNVADSLTALSQAAAGLTNIAPAFKQVAHSANALFDTFRSFKPGAYNQKINGLAVSLSKVGNALNQFVANSAGLSDVNSALSKLPSALSGMSGSNYTDKIAKTKDALSELSKATDGLGGSGSSLNNLRMAIGGMPKALNEFNAAFENGTMSHNIETVGTAFQQLSDSLSKVNSDAFSIIGKFVNSLSKLNDLTSVKNLSENLKQAAQDIANFAKELVGAIPDEVLQKFAILANAIANIGANSNKSFNTKSVTDLTQKTTSASKAFTWLATAARKAAVMTGSVLAASVRTLASYFRQCVVYGTKLGNLPLQMLISPIKGIAGHLNNARVAFGNFISRIGKVTLYRAIRAGIKMVTTAVQEGVNNLYIWAGMVGNSFEPTMDSIATSFLYLKNSIGAAVSPLLDALAPALEFVVNEAVDVINIVNQAIATLTGASTWRRAIRSAADYSDNISGLGHDAEDANDAVKELKKTILGFDEINRLDDKTKTIQKANNGKDPTGYYANQGAFSFEEVEITRPVVDMVNKLKEAWEHADFTEIGSTIAGKVGTALLNAPWDEKIKPATVKVAKSLGTLLNGLLDYNGSEGGKKLWDGIAYTIYNGIDTAVLGYTTFFNTVHWDGIGAGIGAAMADVLEHINWTTGENSVASALAAFPNAVIDAFTGFNSQFTTDKFKELGDHIGSTVSTALTLINWSGLFGNALTLFNNVLAGINGALESFDWSAVKNSIVKGIKNIPVSKWEDLGTNIANTIVNVAKFGTNLITTLGTAIGNLGWSSIGSKIGSKLHEEIGKIKWTEGANNLATAFTTLPNGIITAAESALAKLTTSDFEIACGSVGTAISGALKLIKWSELFNTTVNFCTKLLAGMNSALTNFDWSGVKDAIWSGIDSIPNTKWGELGKQIGQAIGNVIAFGANIADFVISSIKKISWSKLMNGIWSGICDSIEENYGGWDGAAKALAGWIGNNLDIISIGLTFAIGAFTFKALATTFATEVMTKIGLMQVPGKSVAFGQWVKALEVVAGLAIAIQGIKTTFSSDATDSVGTKLKAAVWGALQTGLGGALVGFGLASTLEIPGLVAGAWGLAIGMGVSLNLSVFKAIFDEAGTSGLAWAIGLGIASAIAGAKFIGYTTLAGSVTAAAGAAALGFTLAAVVTLAIVKFTPEMQAGADAAALSELDPNGTLYYTPNEDGTVTQHGGSSSNTSSDTSLFGMTAYGSDNPGSIDPTLKAKLFVTADQENVEGEGKKVTGWLSTYFGNNKPITPVQSDSSNATTVATDTVTYITHYIDKHKPKTKVEADQSNAESSAKSVRDYVNGYLDKNKPVTRVAPDTNNINTTASTIVTNASAYMQKNKPTVNVQSNKTNDENTASAISGHIGRYFGNNPAAAKVDVSQNDANTAASKVKGKIGSWFNTSGNQAEAKITISNAGLAASSAKTNIGNWFDVSGNQGVAKITISNAENAAYLANNEVTSWFSDPKNYGDANISVINASLAAEGGRDAITNWFNKKDNKALAKIKVDNASKAAENGLKALNTWFSTKTKDDGRKAKVHSIIYKPKSTAADGQKAIQNYLNNKTAKVYSDLYKPKTTAATAFVDIQKYFDDHTVTISFALKAVKSAIDWSKQYQSGNWKNQAEGGIYKNGAWHPVTEYAVGGYPAGAQMFIAREAGPELVGTIGGNTAVVNNDQIVASVSAGVAQAVASVLGGGGQTNEVTVMVDSEVLYRAMKKGERRANGRYATSVVVG